MRLYLILCAAFLAGCAATTTSTAYVPQAVAPAAAPCAPAVAPAVRYVPVAPAPVLAPQAAPCAGGTCAAPQAYAGGYTVSETRYSLSSQGAQAAMIPAELIGCAANFARCVWQTVIGPILPPGPSSNVVGVMAVPAAGCR